MVFGYLSVIVILAQVAEPTPRTIPPSTKDIACEAVGPIEAKAQNICASGPEGMRPCRKLARELGKIEKPSLDQRMALYVAQDALVYRKRDRAKRDELKQRSLARLRSLADDYQDSPKVLLELALELVHEDEDVASIPLLRRVLELEPACTGAAHILAQVIELGDGDTPAKYREAYGYLLHAYTHSSDLRKLSYASSLMFYLGIMAEEQEHFFDDEHPADKMEDDLRSQIVADMELGNLPLDEAHRTESLNLLCNDYVLEIGIESVCFEAMALIVERDVREGRPLGEDILRGINRMADGIIFYSELTLDPITIQDQLGKRAGHAIFLRDLLDKEPEQHRTSLFYETYGGLVSGDRRVEMYRKAWALDSVNGELGMKVADLLRRMKRYDEARRAYQDVIIHSDDRPFRSHTYIFYGYETWADAAADNLRDMEKKRLRDSKQ